MVRHPARDGKVHVMSAKCDTCIFRPGNLMHLQEGRVEQMVADSIKGQGAIPCHKTLSGDRAVCRGFFDVHKNDVQGLQIAERLGLAVFDGEPDEGDE